MAYILLHLKCGCSSGVERDLAKVDVEGSNPFARSNLRPVIPVFFYGFGIFTLRVLQFQYQFVTTCRSSLLCFISYYVKTPSTGCFLTYAPSLTSKIKSSEIEQFSLPYYNKKGRGFTKNKSTVVFKLQ